MNIGIRLHDTAPGTLAERLAFAKAQGFSCAHLALSKAISGFSMADAPALLTDELAAEVRGAFADAGMECAVLGCYLALATKDEEELRRTQAIYRAHLRFAPKIGARVVGTETPAAPSAGLDRAACRSEEAFQLFLDNVRPLVRCAEEEGAVLAIEPVVDHIVYTAERAERMLEALNSDHVQIILDAINLLASDALDRAEAIVDDAVRRLGDRVRILHMKDYVPEPGAFRPRSLACGLGGMKYDSLLRLAMANDIPMTLEDTVPDNAEAARLCLEREAARLR